MSGLEAVGLFLGIIPLIIEAFDHCGRTYDAFATYQKYPKEIMKIDSKLGAQRTVFRNNCNNLLTKMTGDRQRAHDMLSKPSHEMWRDENLQESFLRQIDSLDQTLYSCRRTMEQIHDALKAISRETDGFRVLLNGEQKVCTMKMQVHPRNHLAADSCCSRAKLLTLEIGTAA